MWIGFFSEDVSVPKKGFLYFLIHYFYHFTQAVVIVFRMGSTTAGQTTVTPYSVAGLLMSPLAAVFTSTLMATGKPQSVRRR